MEKSQTVQITPGQMKEIISAVVEAIPANMDFNTAQHWIGMKKKLGNEIKKIFIEPTYSVDLIVEWESFYQDTFGIKADFSNLRIPEKEPGFNRLIIMAKGMTPQRLYDKCVELFPCWKWTSDSLSERTSKNSAYAIWVCDCVEADEGFKNLSADKIKAQDISTETLEERLIHELKYFRETGKHLDIENITLCAGSHYPASDGDVPCVSWHNSRLEVSRCLPRSAHDYLRPRRVVSF